MTPTIRQQQSRRVFLGSSVLVPLAVLLGCSGAARRGRVHVVLLDSGVAGLPEFDAYDISHEGEAPATAHGTQVASLLLGVSGADAAPPLPADRIRITSINVESAGRPVGDLLVAGLRRATEISAEVVNVSLGLRQPTEELESAAVGARDRGALVVASAGNVSFLAPDFPARYEDVLSVGAVDAHNRRAEFSPGDVDVSAIGVGLPVLGLDGTLSRESGTSLACAVVSNEVIRGLLDGSLQRPHDYRGRVGS